MEDTSFLKNKGVTIQDIADKLGISKSTVSKALSGATDVNERTRERVLSCASEIGYVVKPDRTPKQKNVIIFIYGIYYDRADQFGYEVILGIQAAAADRGFGVNIVAIGSEELDTGAYRSALDSGSYEGCFFLGFKPHPNFIRRAEELNLPMILLDNSIDSPLAARVGCDSADGIAQMVNYLYKKGHRKIGFLGAEQDSIVTRERETAYTDTLEKLGIAADSALIRYGHFSGENTGEYALSLADEGVSAIVCVSDILAAAAIRELTGAGYKIPANISVTGFDNLASSQYCRPPITTVNQNRIHIGKIAFFTFLQIESGMNIASLSLRTELVERESVADISCEETV